MPLHAWLPQAHPAAPSHISALMSGVMLKIAVYGFVRFAFDLLPDPHWGWGVIVLIVGSVSALVGVLFALGAGAIAHTCHERDMEHLGGLIHRMPITAGLFLVGCISISALPPFNGFVSEWLTFQTFLQVSLLDSGTLRAILPFAAAMLALTGALAAACFVKVFGIVFLGVARSRHARHAHEPDRGMLVGQGLLAALCLAFGVLPFLVVDALRSVAASLVRGDLAHATASGWLWLTPVAPQVASYSAPLVPAGIALAGLAISITRQRQRRTHPVRRDAPWDCGFGGLQPRMQYTGAAFAMPLRRVFAPLWQLHESVEPAAPATSTPGERVARLRHTLQIEDRTWGWLHLPPARWIHATARQVARIQTGRIRTYLAHSFITLLVLLWVVT